MSKRKAVTIDLEELKLLCLSVDYIVKGQVKDMVEDISITFGEKFKFDTHKFRIQLDKKGFKGAL